MLLYFGAVLEALYVPKIAWALDGGPVCDCSCCFANVVMQITSFDITDGQGGRNNDEPKKNVTV